MKYTASTSLTSAVDKNGTMIGVLSLISVTVMETIVVCVNDVGVPRSIDITVN